MNALLALLPQIVDLLKRHGMTVVGALFILIAINLYFDGQIVFSLVSLVCAGGCVYIQTMLIRRPDCDPDPLVEQHEEHHE